MVVIRLIKTLRSALTIVFFLFMIFVFHLMVTSRPNGETVHMDQGNQVDHPVLKIEPTVTDKPIEPNIIEYKTIIEKTNTMNQVKIIQNTGPILRPRIDVKNISILKSAILDINVEQKVFNADRYKFNAGRDGIVILVQVHDRAEYLRHLIESLSKAKDIGSSLLIFSHDVYSEELNTIIDSISFCPVMQIFYPYSLQVYQNEFPGHSPNDCPRDVGRVKAKQIGCNNADHPDKYGHYREAKYTQTKHHWFWKIHRVFDELYTTKNFEGLVLLLEEDHYVSPDFIPTLRLMQSFKQEACKDCSILTLGNYNKVPVFETVSTSVYTNPWVSSKHNLGMALDRTLWQKMKTCYKKFCSFDDYNWDWTLQYLSAVCIPDKIKALIMKSPKVFHIGECGVHHKGKNCDSKTKVQQIDKLLETNKKHLFPNSLKLINERQVIQRTPKPNGGWGDVRDHNLCNSFIQDTKQR